MPRLSAIVAVDNEEKELEQLLEGILGAGSSDLELVCVRYGFADESAGAFHGLAQADGRVQMLSCGARDSASALNLGLAHASGDYVIFPDAGLFYAAGVFESICNL